MSLGRWSQPLWIFAGALCALLAGWAAIAFGSWLTILAVDALDPAPSLLPMPEYLIGFGALWLVAFAVIGFAMGLVCASFWHRFESIERQQQRAIGVTIIFFLPVALLGIGAICVLAIGFPLLMFTLRLGMEKRARWRHFVGLSNDWERAKDEI